MRKTIVRYTLYSFIPIFVIFTFYSQLQTLKVIDMHNYLDSKTTIRDLSKSSSVSSVMLFIPGIGPFLEMNSTTTLFNKMKIVLDEYSEDNSSKVLADMLNSYIEGVEFDEPSLYLHQYNSTIGSMLEFFNNYSTLGSESSSTLQSKEVLSKNIEKLLITTILKVVIYSISFILGLIGFFVFKGRYSNKLIYN